MQAPQLSLVDRSSLANFHAISRYLSVAYLEGRDGCHNFYGSPIGGTIMPLGEDERKSGIMTFPGVTNAYQSSSIASIIAHQESSKYTDLFGLGWQTSYQLNLPITTTVVDLYVLESNILNEGDKMLTLTVETRQILENHRRCFRK
jgi:hypothetical protein